MLFRLGWIVQAAVALALLSLSLWIHQQAIAGYTTLPWLALIVAVLLVAGKTLAIAYYPYAVHSSAVGSYSTGLVKLLQLALAVLSLVCALSFFADQIEHRGFGTLWLLEQVSGFVKQPAYGALPFWCALFLSLLLELALFVVLQQLALAYWPLLQIEQEYRLRRYQLLLQADSRLHLARCDEQALRKDIKAERDWLERRLRRAANETTDG
jgi:hypothetical protein